MRVVAELQKASGWHVGGDLKRDKQTLTGAEIIKGRETVRGSRGFFLRHRWGHTCATVRDTIVLTADGAFHPEFPCLIPDGPRLYSEPRSRCNSPGAVLAWLALSCLGLLEKSADRSLDLFELPCKEVVCALDPMDAFRRRN